MTLWLACLNLSGVVVWIAARIVIPQLLECDGVLNRDLTGLTLGEVKLLRSDPDAPVPGELIAIAGRFATATDEARAIVEKVFAVDRDSPQLLAKRSIIVDAYLDGVRVQSRRR